MKASESAKQSQIFPIRIGKQCCRLQNKERYVFYSEFGDVAVRAENSDKSDQTLFSNAKPLLRLNDPTY